MNNECVKERRFGDVCFKYPENLIVAFRGGSALHGASVEGKADEDWCGVFVEPAEHVFGLGEYGTFVFNSSGAAQKNQPGDVDVTLHSLRKFIRLAANGNPTIISYLFVDDPVWCSTSWAKIQINRNAFLAKSHIKAFLGYAKQQYERLKGERGQKNVHRPDLEEKYGFDTKYAMHVVRLLQEGMELLREGKITYPRPNREELIGIRTGSYTFEAVLEMIEGLMGEVPSLLDHSKLPPTVDRDRINKLSAWVHQDFYRWKFVVDQHKDRQKGDENV